MLQKITEDELKLAEALYNPVTFIENIVPKNHDAPGEWDEEEECIKIRLYQIPTLSYEYMVAEDPNKTEQENFNLKKGAGEIYNIGGRKFGKCNWANEKCLLADGTFEKFVDLIGKKRELFVFDEKTSKVTKGIAEFFDNGIKECFELKLTSGKKTINTGNHPFFTDRGWVDLQDLKVGDFIGTPREYKFDNRKKSDSNIAILLGYLLGDGSCTGQIGFTNINKELISEWKETVEYFDCKTKKYKMNYPVTANKLKTKKNKILNLVRKYEINTKSIYKKIPKEVFEWENKNIALLINRLFACDAHVNQKYYTVEYCSSSEQMIRQVQHLLLRFGIHSRLHDKIVKLNNKEFQTYRLFISQDFDKFFRLIGIKSKTPKQLRNKLYSTSDRIPNSFNHTIFSELKGQGIIKNLSLRHMRQYNSSRLKWQEIADKSNNDEITKIAFSDIYWDTVKSIEYKGKLSTVAVQVPKYHTYICNDIISHNSFITLFCDALLTIVHYQGKICALASFDHKHLKKIMEDICNYVEQHPFYKIFHLKGGKGGTGIKTVSRSPYSIKTRHGCKFIGINENVIGTNPGTDYHQYHYHKFMYEEASYESEEGHIKRVGSTSELGAIERLSGIPDVTDTDYLGKILNNPNKAKTIVRLPQYVRHTWNNQQNEDAIEEYNGEGSLDYKLNVDGIRIEGAYGVFEMERLKKCYNLNKKVKQYSISKDNFNNFKTEIRLEHIPSEIKYICADIGDGGAPTEIIIMYKIGDRYSYIYNITLHRLDDDQQSKIFKWLYEQVSGAFIGLDCTDGTGRAIFRELLKTIPEENLCSVIFSENIKVGHEEITKSDGTKVILRDKKTKKAIFKEENTMDWADKRLQYLFYKKLFEIYLDDKFYKQFATYKYVQSGTRKKRQRISDDHLLQAFQVLAITMWNKEFTPFNKKKRGLGVGAV